MLSYIIKGLILGFSVSAPVGPIGIICIDRTLKRGMLVGFISGLGATAADTIYGLIAGLGLNGVTTFLTVHTTAIKVIGCLAIVLVGLKQVFSYKIRKKFKDQETRKDLFHSFFSIFLLTFMNPLTIFFFLAVLSGMGISLGVDHMGILIVFLLSVLVGSASWWLSLAGLVGVFRHRLSASLMIWINRISGTVLILFGTFGLSQLFF